MTKFELVGNVKKINYKKKKSKEKSGIYVDIMQK